MAAIRERPLGSRRGKRSERERERERQTERKRERTNTKLVQHKNICTRKLTWYISVWRALVKLFAGARSGSRLFPIKGFVARNPSSPRLRFEGEGSILAIASTVGFPEVARPRACARVTAACRRRRCRTGPRGGPGDTGHFKYGPSVLIR
jgi:hypothetical protein